MKFWMHDNVLQYTCIEHISNYFYCGSYCKYDWSQIDGNVFLILILLCGF